jgi:hypothetical protein
LFITKQRMAVAVLLLLASCFVIPLGVASKAFPLATSDTSFSVMQISDTQYLSWLNPNLYFDLTNWIVNNSLHYNLKMVIHTGDLVDTPTHVSEWEVANSAMLKLYTNEIPYCWDAGNYDQLPPNDASNLWLGDPDTDWLGSKYPAFNQTIMRQEPYWVSDAFDGKDTAVSFSFQDYQFLIINVEFLANSSSLDWMQKIITNNPSANIIIATHDYLNQTGGYGAHSISNEGILDYDWGNNFKAILDQYPNVFMTVSGHILSWTTGANNEKVGNREEIYFNRQELNNKVGAASIRIYTFDLSNMHLNVSTYSLDSNEWLTDSQNQFNFPIDPRINTIPEIPHFIAFTTVAITVYTLLIIIIRRTRDGSHAPNLACWQRENSFQNVYSSLSYYVITFVFFLCN